MVREDGADGPSAGSSRPMTVTNPLRQPFMNFLKDFRQEHKDVHGAVEMARAGGNAWNKLTREEKEPYYEMSRRAPKRTKRKKRLITARKTHREAKRKRERSPLLDEDTYDSDTDSS